MNRAPLTRSPMARTEVKAKTCTAPKCGREFFPQRMGQVVCGPVCARRLVKAKKNAERADDQARREKLKSRAKWEAECRTIVQAIARLRDRDDGCISCDLPSTWSGQWHGSHFRSHGACSALQFNLWNIHKACSPCNRDKGGNIINYRPRLIAKIGAERVDWLMSQNGVFKPPMEYYERFKAVMGKRLRRLKASAE